MNFMILIIEQKNVTMNTTQLFKQASLMKVYYKKDISELLTLYKHSLTDKESFKTIRTQCVLFMLVKIMFRYKSKCRKSRINCYLKLNIHTCRKGR